jgi:hypothetical protein
MIKKSPLTAPERRIEEIRAIRHRLFGGAGMDLATLRAMGNRVPKGFQVLHGVRAIVPLAAQLSKKRRKKVTVAATV